ncbi:hypothetical protein Fot_41531 [Forsythia ovata]|uniref:Embryonic stem cell-specific 5-hydroxymethylcytosine-binding protein n=1 Tax=Forsythia ovata TaxID=205694 RepID=A0ABD1RII0_9LAMI
MDRYRPSYNVAPGFNVPVVRREDGGDCGGAVVHCMKWGLIPSFTKKAEKPDHFKMFNARSESIREKASFRRLVPNNRCLVAVEGFYEWKKDGSRKQPYYIHFKDGRPLVFAALFDSWKNPEGEVLYTFTIVTTSSSSALAWLHDRMPVILENKDSTDRWLNDSSLTNLDTILKPYEESDLAWYPVTPAMGKLSFDGSECIKEVQVKTEETRSISQFFSKGVNHGPEPKLENPSIKNEPIEINQQKGTKEVPETQDDSITNKDDYDIKPDVASVSVEGTGDIPGKRIYEELSADAKPFAKETDRLNTSPVRKKGKGATDKQPTLLSFFRKS